MIKNNSDTIPFRLNFIKDLLKKNELEPLIKNDNIETEDFIYCGYEHIGGASKDTSYDTTNIRVLLNKRKLDFYKTISSIGGQLLYVKSGTTGHTFKGIIKKENSEIVNYGIKVVAYPKNSNHGDQDDIRRPENAELMMIRLLSYFIIRRQTPHIILPIGTFYTNITPFVNLLDGNYVSSSNTKYCEFVKRYKKNYYHDNVSILISEWANRGDLLDFIKKNHKKITTIHWKVIFFQLLSVLAVIQSKFPSFRHNDLKANNVLIQKIDIKNSSKCSYRVRRNEYIVPNIGYRIKIWDFDFACIPGLVDNYKVYAKWTDEINVKPVKNKYYDMHFFFNTLIRRGFFPQLIEDPNISVEIKEFINRIIPQKYRTGKYVSNRKGRIMVDDEFTTPNNVLKNDPFFEEFRRAKRINKKRYILKK